MSDASGPAPHRDSAFHDPNSTSSGLLAAAVRRDPEAWVTLVDRYSRLVFAWCRRRGLDADESAEVLQIVMLQVARFLPGFRKDGRTAAFRRWLSTITSTKISEYVRNARRHPRAEGGSEASERMQNWVDAASPDSSDGEASSALLERFWVFLAVVEAEVEPTTWKAFWLTMIEERTSPEVGAMLGMTDNAVRLAKMRIFRRLRELAQEPDAEGEYAPRDG